MTKEPTPIRYQSGICLGWVIFATEEEALAYGKIVHARGDKINGGYYDGVPCGAVEKVADGWSVTVA
jgi:hypothetical protein